jgi:hypothetical protein
LLLFLESRVFQCAFEEIGYTQSCCLAFKILHIKRSSAHFENTQNIIPLSIRNFAAHFVPLKFSKNDIFWRLYDKRAIFLSIR